MILLLGHWDDIVMLGFTGEGGAAMTLVLQN